MALTLSVYILFRWPTQTRHRDASLLPLQALCEGRGNAPVCDDDGRRPVA